MKKPWEQTWYVCGPGFYVKGPPPHEHSGQHEIACPLDAALTAAGFDTPEKRDEARKIMGQR